MNSADNLSFALYNADKANSSVAVRRMPLDSSTVNIRFTMCASCADADLTSLLFTFSCNKGSAAIDFFNSYEPSFWDFEMYPPK